KDGDPNIMIAGLRAARQISKNILPVISSLVNDSDPQVRRECAIALRHNKSPEAPKLWATLAMQYKGDDRWYLEALGIGADRQWDPFFQAYLAQNGQPLETHAGRDLVWRSRGVNSLAYLAKLASDSSDSLKSRLRYFRSFDFHTGPEKSQTLLKMLADNKSDNTDFNLLVLHDLDPAVAQKSSIAKAALEKVLRATYGSPAYINLVRQYKLKSENPRLQKLALAKYNEPEGVEAVRLLIESGDKDVLKKMLSQSHGDSASMFITVLGKTGYTETIDLLQNVLLSNSYDTGMRSKAAQMIGKSYGGEDRVIDLLKNNMVPTNYIPAVVNSVKEGQRSGIYKQAITYLPGASKVETKPVPTIASLMELKGDAGKGMKVFQTVCSVCHQVKGNGTDFGPKLSEIGSKLPREALFKSIISPSSAISFGYETSQLNLKNGTKATGIIFNKTKDEIDLKYPGGTNQQFQINDVKNIKELPNSLMPEMSESLSNQEIADVVEYLKTLTKK
ncbi:MAG: c-type cytochrome, partial [Ginsengibacter sp.]